MKHIAQVVDLHGTNKSEQGSSNTYPPAADLARLWAVLASIYQSFPVAPVDPGGVWRAMLAGMDYSDFKIGLAGLKPRAERLVSQGKPVFPPSPDEFAALCRPRSESFGMMSEDKAFDIALKWKHLSPQEKSPEVLFAVRAIKPDYMTFSAAKAQEARAMFAKAWAKAVAHKAAGNAFDPVPLAVEHRAAGSALRDRSARSERERLALLGSLGLSRE